MGSYSSHLLLEWNVLDECDRTGAVRRVLGIPNLWLDGSLIFACGVWCFLCSVRYVCVHVPGDALRHRSTVIWHNGQIGICWFPFGVFS